MVDTVDMIYTVDMVYTFVVNCRIAQFNKSLIYVQWIIFLERREACCVLLSTMGNEGWILATSRSLGSFLSWVKLARFSVVNC